MTRTLGAIGRLIRGVLALAVLAGLLGGIPWLLVGFIGWPLPDHIPQLAEVTRALTSPLDDQTILNLLAVIAWVLWLLFCRDVLAEAVLAVTEATDARHGRPQPQRRPVGPVRFVATALVGAIAAAVPLDAVLDALSTRPAVAAAAAHPPTVADRPSHPTAARPPTAAHAPRTTVTVTPDRDQASSLTTLISPGNGGYLPAWARAAPGGVHHVVEGDNLWDIADTRLGDPHRWREIYVLNRGKPQANGYALTDPDMIDVGWVLALPARDRAQPVPGAARGEHTESPSSTPAPATPTPATNPPAQGPTASTAPATPTPTASAPCPPAPTAADSTDENPTHDGDWPAGITLPSQGWVSLALAATIAAVATLLRLRHRRRARLSFPIPLHTGPATSPVPESLRVVDAAGNRQLTNDPSDDHPLAGVLPTPPGVPAPIGVDHHGDAISLFDLPGIALHGLGAEPAARAVLASALSTGVREHPADRPVVVTSVDTLARLLPAGTPPAGLDPRRETFDGERLIILADVASVVTHAEEEMIHRRRLLDSLDAGSIAEANARADHAEQQPAYVLLLSGSQRHAGRIRAVAAHGTALHLHIVVLGGLDGIPAITLAADGTVTAAAASDLRTPAARLATLGASDLIDVLALVAEAAPRSESGADIDDLTRAADTEVDSDLGIPVPASGTLPLVRLSVLGPVTVSTDAGPITTGMRSGSYATLALLAAHPHGRTLDQIATDLHPDTDPGTAVKRVRTDITTARRVLRTTTGQDDTMFVVYDAATGLYHLDPNTIDVDLWRMLAAIATANTADDDAACLAALREAASYYRGDFAEDQDRAWISDYATTYRHAILNVHARIAELLELDHPDQAIDALERAVAYDPLNEELYQRIMRIHGRKRRPDAVRRTLRLLEERLAELGAEPSEATRRLAARQLTPSLGKPATSAPSPAGSS